MGLFSRKKKTAVDSSAASPTAKPVKERYIYEPRYAQRDALACMPAGQEKEDVDAVRAATALRISRSVSEVSLMSSNPKLARNAHSFSTADFSAYQNSRPHSFQNMSTSYTSLLNAPAVPAIPSAYTSPANSPGPATPNNMTRENSLSNMLTIRDNNADARDSLNNGFNAQQSFLPNIPISKPALSPLSHTSPPISSSPLRNSETKADGTVRQDSTQPSPVPTAGNTHSLAPSTHGSSDDNGTDAIEMVQSPARNHQTPTAAPAATEIRQSLANGHEIPRTAAQSPVHDHQQFADAQPYIDYSRPQSRAAHDHHHDPYAQQSHNNPSAFPAFHPQSRPYTPTQYAQYPDHRPYTQDPRVYQPEPLQRAFTPGAHQRSESINSQDPRSYPPPPHAFSHAGTYFDDRYSRDYTFDPNGPASYGQDPRLYGQYDPRAYAYGPPQAWAPAGHNYQDPRHIVSPPMGLPVSHHGSPNLSSVHPASRPGSRSGYSIPPGTVHEPMPSPAPAAAGQQAANPEATTPSKKSRLSFLRRTSSAAVAA